MKLVYLLLAILQRLSSDVFAFEVCVRTRSQSSVEQFKKKLKKIADRSVLVVVAAVAVNHFC